MGRIMFPKNSYVGALAPSTSERDPIWREGLYRGHQVDMRSFQWALVQYDLCPCTKGTFGQRDGTQGEGHVKMKTETGDGSVSQRTPRAATRNWAGGMGQAVPQGLQKEPPC